VERTGSNRFLINFPLDLIMIGNIPCVYPERPTFNIYFRRFAVNPGKLAEFRVSGFKFQIFYFL